MHQRRALQFILALGLGGLTFAGPAFAGKGRKIKNLKVEHSQSVNKAPRSAIPPRPDLETFRKICREHRAQASNFLIDAPEVGTVDYFPTYAIEGNQSEFSLESMNRKLTKTLDKEHLATGEDHEPWVLPFPKNGTNQNQALYPIAKKIRGIFYRGKIYVVDGHHRALNSIYVGAKLIPVMIVDNLSALTPQEFEDHMDTNYMSYFRSPSGRRLKRVDICEMIDNPLLEFVRQVFERLDFKFEFGRLELSNIRGSEWVIGFKTDEDMAFLEIEMAHALMRGNFSWQPGQPIELHHLAEALEIFKKDAAERPKSRLSEVLLFDAPMLMAELDLPKLVMRHLEERSCQDKLIR